VPARDLQGPARRAGPLVRTRPFRDTRRPPVDAFSRQRRAARRRDVDGSSRSSPERPLHFELGSFSRRDHRMALGDGPEGPRQIQSLALQTPKSLVATQFAYDGDFAVNPADTCGFEMEPGDLRSQEWRWQEVGAVQPRLFESFLGRGQLGPAWLTLNSPGWDLREARAALQELDRRASDDSAAGGAAGGVASFCPSNCLTPTGETCWSCWPQKPAPGRQSPSRPGGTCSTRQLTVSGALITAPIPLTVEATGMTITTGGEWRAGTATTPHPSLLRVHPGRPEQAHPALGVRLTPALRPGASPAVRRARKRRLP